MTARTETRAAGGADAPRVSVVIPVHNEQAMLVESAQSLIAGLDAMGWSFEVLLSENGSRDRTLELAQALARQDTRVQALHRADANYGGALRDGIVRARGRWVICEEIDICDVDFARRAVAELEADRADIVVGSKAMKGARDERPLLRRTATRAYNGLLRLTVGFHGTDTHGLKAFDRAAVAPVALACVIEHDVFASELVVRCERAGLGVREIPLVIREKRAPSIQLLRRVPRVVHNLGRLMIAIHAPGLAQSAQPSAGRAARDQEHDR